MIEDEASAGNPFREAARETTVDVIKTVIQADKKPGVARPVRNLGSNYESVSP